MKFVLAEKRTYWWPVEVYSPSEKKPGTFDRQKFDMQFEALSRSEMKAHDEEMREITDLAELQAKMDEVILKSACDWKEVVDEKGEPIPFSIEALVVALNDNWIRNGIWASWLKSQRNEDGSVKN